MTSRVHIVLGATGGIGSALVRRLTQRGETVFALARDQGRLEELSRATGAASVVCDAREAESVRIAVDSALEKAGRIDGAACLVGSILIKPVQSTSTAEFVEALNQNLLPAFHLVRAAAPAMGRGEGGSIVLMSSAAARIGLPHHEAIAAAKAGVEGLTRSAAASFAARNVRVNAVAAGLVRTPLSARLTASPQALEASAKLHALGRIGEADEVASLLDWLLSADATWATGQVLGMDGGLASLAVRR